MILAVAFGYAYSYKRAADGRDPMLGLSASDASERGKPRAEAPVRPPATPSDEELLGRVGLGDKEALAVLFDRHKEALFRYLRGQVGEASMAEDLLQETFLRIWRTGPRLPPVSRAQGYLYRVALNLARDHQRRRRPVVPWDPGLEEDQPTDAPLMDDDVANREWLHEAIRRLAPAQQTVLGLHYFADRPVDEIAAILDVAPSTVKTRLHRAYRRLAALLRQGGDEEPRRPNQDPKKGDHHGPRARA